MLCFVWVGIHRRFAYGEMFPIAKCPQNPALAPRHETLRSPPARLPWVPKCKWESDVWGVMCEFCYAAADVMQAFWSVGDH